LWEELEWKNQSEKLEQSHTRTGEGVVTLDRHEKQNFRKHYRQKSNRQTDRSHVGWISVLWKDRQTSEREEDDKERKIQDRITIIILWKCRHTKPEC
jgi:hypothetical protein